MELSQRKINRISDYDYRQNGAYYTVMDGKCESKGTADRAAASE